MATDWQLDRGRKLVLLLAVGFVVYRVLLASQSGYTFHQGWNEGHYSLVAWGFLEHPIVPRYGNHYVYNVPPLFPYLVTLSFRLVGQSEVGARLTSILATGGGILATHELGRVIYRDRRIALTGAGLFALLPYVQLYGGRAQTDALMVSLTIASLTCIIYGYRQDSILNRYLIAGGVLFATGFAAKQPAVILPGVILIWLLFKYGLGWDRKLLGQTGLLIGSGAVSLTPLLGWWYLNYRRAPTAFVETWEHELFHRTAPFANVELLLAIGLFLGMTPPILLLAGDRFPTRMSDSSPYDELPLILWLVLFGAFVLYRTPQGHQYYALVLTPAIALLAGARLVDLPGTNRLLSSYSTRLVVTALVVLSCVTGTIVLFELSGEFSIAERGGEEIAREAGVELTNRASANDRILVSSGYRPSVQWYVRDDIPPEQVDSYRTGDLTEDRLRSAANKTSGTLYVVVPTPYWEPVPDSLEPIYTTSRYEFTFSSSLPTTIASGSKFMFYLHDRRLTVYKYSPADE